MEYSRSRVRTWRACSGQKLDIAPARVPGFVGGTEFTDESAHGVFHPHRNPYQYWLQHYAPHYAIIAGGASDNGTAGATLNLRVPGFW